MLQVATNLYKFVTLFTIFSESNLNVITLNNLLYKVILKIRFFTSY